MKITGNTKLTIKRIETNYGKRDLYNLIVKDKELEAELFCRLTNNAQDELRGKDIEKGINIEILDSFFTVDKYWKGEEMFTKPVVVLSNIKVI